MSQDHENGLLGLLPARSRHPARALRCPGRVRSVQPAGAAHPPWRWNPATSPPATTSGFPRTPIGELSPVAHRLVGEWSFPPFNKLQVKPCE